MLKFFKAIFFVCLLAQSVSVLLAQNSGETEHEYEYHSNDSLKYQTSNTRYFDLIHTKLEVSFDWSKQYLYGKANLTLTPYFFEQNQLVLDAKGMDIAKVELINQQKKTSLQYKYNGVELIINLQQSYTKKDTLEVYIEYVAKPNERQINGSEAITEDKGLYFINPEGKDLAKPRQIWTQGETESSSVWFPTIDSPNERCTQEISITVDEQYNTLSNGVLTSQVNNQNGTKTDTWVMNMPHAPYLFMMAIGDFARVHDQWNGVPLTYHVEKEFETEAKAIFGNTPEMMTLFSELLDYPYPWKKYDQIVVRDYVSGAMENTTASVFMENLQINKREMVDYNWDDIIAHELFHQWFGDLVTCESWSNLTLNEGFASYAEYLWNEHKLGRDAADYSLLSDQEQYFAEAVDEPKDLIRYFYEDKEDMFDSHSYNKGAAVLHMLRNYLGDQAFFAGLNTYLKDNAYQSVELSNLRLAFEKVTGEDLNWFFDQWYFFPGHPVLSVEHKYADDTLKVQVEQLQLSEETPIYKLPVFIDVWKSGKKTSYPVILEEAVEVYEFAMVESPDLVVFDSERQLLAEIRHPMTEKEMVFQIENVDDVYGRLETMDSLYSFQNKKNIESTLLNAFEDPFYIIRQYALEYLIENEVKLKKYSVQADKLLKDSSSFVRAVALTYVGGEDFESYRGVIQLALRDSSYMVAGAAISQFVENDIDLPIDLEEELAVETNINIALPLGMYYVKKTDDKSFDWFEKKVLDMKSAELYYFVQVYAEKLIGAPEKNRVTAVEIFKNMAINNSDYTARLSGYQALLLLTDIDGVDEILETIKAAEKDQRLVQFYNQF